MKIRAVRWVASIITAAFAFGLSASPSPRIRGTASGSRQRALRTDERTVGTHTLTISVQTDRKTYHLGDTITTTVFLTNTGKDDFYILGHLGWGYSAALTFHLLQGNDHEIQRGFLEDEVTPPPQSRRDFVCLEPDEFLGTVRHDTTKYLAIKDPGKYSIVVDYNSAIAREDKDLTFGLDVWSILGHAVIESKPAPFTVLPVSKLPNR